MRKRDFHVSIEDLFEHSVHFGHQKQRWNPKMSRHIYTQKDGAHIIDLNDTAKAFSHALEFMYEVFLEGGNILFVATRSISREIVSQMCKDLGCFYVNNRWLGGTLSNWSTILNSIKRLEYLENLKKDEFNGFSKREIILMERELAKLNLNFRGIKDMKGLPGAVVVMDCHKEKLALKEAKAIGIPTIGIVDTNSDPDMVTYPIYGNDDSRSAISLYCRLFSQIIKDAQDKKSHSARREKVPLKQIDKEEVIKKAAAMKNKSGENGVKKGKTSVSVDLVRSLYKETGVGVMDCKKALMETRGNLKKAKSLLMEKGLASTNQRASRVAAEGVIALAQDASFGVMIELNCETDFVARNEEFQRLCREICSYSFKDKCTDSSILAKKFKDRISEAALMLSEKIELRRVSALKSGSVFSYIHNTYPGTPDLGRIGVLVSVDTKAASKEIQDFISNLCMHIAAFKPMVLTEKDLDSNLVKEKKNLFEKLARKDGKDEKLIPKIVEGKMKTFRKEVVLMHQAYIMDENKSVNQVLSEVAKDIGKEISVKDFAILVLGEGIETKQEDFAEAVKKATKT